IAVVRSRPLGIKADEPGVPAVGNNCPEHVLSLAEQLGHVIGLVKNSFVVVSPAGWESCVADSPTIQPRLVKAERGNVQARRYDVRWCGKNAPEIRSRCQHLG